MLGILMLWLTHVLCCVWYAVGDGEQINSADGSVIQGWVLHDFGSGLGTSRDLNQSTTEDYVGAVGAAGLFRRYLFAFHAVNPKVNPSDTTTFDSTCHFGKSPFVCDFNDVNH